MTKPDRPSSSLDPYVEKNEEYSLTPESSVSSSLSDICSNDPLGLLQSKHIAAAAAAAAVCANSIRDRKRTRLHKSEEEKREERLAANRKSASDSRKRQKGLISDLQASVSELSKKNVRLARENEELKLQLSEMRRFHGQKEVAASLGLQANLYANGTSLPNQLRSMGLLQQQQVPQLSTASALLRDLIRSRNVHPNNADSTNSFEALSLQANALQGSGLQANVLQGSGLQGNVLQGSGLQSNSIQQLLCSQQKDAANVDQEAALVLVLQRQLQSMANSAQSQQAANSFSANAQSNTLSNAQNHVYSTTRNNQIDINSNNALT
mmetsp:Transcript_55634/g.67086  ORF Transcript_55634/g.67086 Transcript_55634/m.67086 type:complete len:323 (+) Transcript_55634:148-1116(+)